VKQARSGTQHVLEFAENQPRGNYREIHHIGWSRGVRVLGRLKLGESDSLRKSGDCRRHVPIKMDLRMTKRLLKRLKTFLKFKKSIYILKPKLKEQDTIYFKNLTEKVILTHRFN